MDTFTLATVAANAVMGVVYVAYGAITLNDVRKHASDRGSSHMAYGFAAIMWTCGPHHLDHAAHLALGNGPATGLDLFTVGLGLPVGLTWFGLRVEALRGGRGDRPIRSDLAVDLYRTVWASAFIVVLVTVLATPAAGLGWGEQAFSLRVMPNVIVAVLYLVVAAMLLRTQLRRHTVDGSWSLSGLALSGVFMSCAGMHAMLVGAIGSGAYAPDDHLLAIDLLSIPATLYFIGVVWLVSERRIPDHLEAAGDVASPTAAEADGVLVGSASS